jgi:hypothetical protein
VPIQNTNEEDRMETVLAIPEKEHSLRVLLAKMENKCIYQRGMFIGDPWALLRKAEELKRIINQVPQPNPRINMYEGG